MQLIGYIAKGKKITAEYNSGILDHVYTDIHEKAPCLKKKKIIFHQYNPPKHEGMGKPHDVVYNLLGYPPYSHDLPPSDFYVL